MFNQLKNKLPVIVSDIDGVLVRGKTPIPGTLPALRRIKQLNLPFTCLTNGGGCTQSVKATKLNKIFQLQQPYFHKNNMILNHTPLKPELLKQSNHGLLLITGSQDIVGVVEDLGIYNYVTADQLYAIRISELPEPLKAKFSRQDLDVESIKVNINKRLKNVYGYRYYLTTINSIFAINDVSPYQTSLQVISDTYNHKNSHGLALPEYYTAQNDIIWASTFPLPRMAMGPFTYLMTDHIQTFLNIKVSPIIYGKPTLRAFSFVENYMKEMYPEAGNFYMIGDNPKADIRGANSIGWTSILTRTGIFKGEQNDPQDPASLVVSDFKEAIDKILQLERLI